MKTPPRSRIRRRRASERLGQGHLLVALLLTVALAGGCGGGWVETEPEVAARARAEPGWFVDAAWRQWDEVELHSGSWRVEASRGLGGTTLDVYLLALRPGSLRVTVLAPQGTTEAVLVAGPEEIGLWDRSERVAYVGPAEPGAFGRALGLALEPDDAVGTILGYGLTRQRIEDVRWVEEEQRIRVAGEDAVGWLHPLTRRYERLSFADGAVEVRLDDWRQGDWPQPGHIEIRVPDDGLTLELDLSSQNRQPPDPAMFVAERPEGHPVRGLEELTRQGGLLERELRR